MVNDFETREPAESMPEGEQEAERESHLYPIDSQFYGLEPSLGKALAEMGNEAEQYALPEINLPETRRRELANKSQIFRFFKKELDLSLNRDGDVIRLRNKAEREGAENLSKPETTLLVNRLRTIMERAWRATEARFGDRIPVDWGKKMENAMGSERNFGVVSAMKTAGGIPEESEIFKRDKGIGLESDQKKIMWTRNVGAGRGSGETVRKRIREQRRRAAEKNVIPAEDDKEPTEKAA